MGRPPLSVEDRVLRPGYVEILALLAAVEHPSGLTGPQLVSDSFRIHADERESRARRSVRLSRCLVQLRRAGVIEPVAFAPEASLSDRWMGKPIGKGRAPANYWRLTEHGRTLWKGLSAARFIRSLVARWSEVPASELHLLTLGDPSILFVNARHKGSGGALYDPPTSSDILALERAGRDLAIWHWAGNPRVASDWKALQSLKKRYPRDYGRDYPIPESLQHRFWNPKVRWAFGKTARHTMWVVLELNPAYWDSLPIERLERVTKHRSREARIAAIYRAKATRLTDRRAANS